VRGRDGFIAYAQAVRTAFPDFHNEVRELLIDRGRVAACLEYSGTHRGPILAVAPTDGRITYGGVAFFWFDEQEWIARGWVLGDLVNLLKQLDPTKWARLPETRS
jgi:predicted ester cyclase